MLAPFTGFSPKGPRFFSGLEIDNTKEWFEQNRELFETEVKAPVAALIEALPDRFRPMKTYRINRDIRFSSDKSPYKTHLGSVHTRAGGSIEYFHLDKSGIMVAAGAYLMEPAQINRFRAAVLDDSTGRKFEKIAKALSAKDIALDPGGAAPLKTAPRGIPADHPRIDWLRWKGCAVLGRFGGTSIADGPALVTAMVAFWKTAEPLNSWLDEAMAVS